MFCLKKMKPAGFMPVCGPILRMPNFLVMLRLRILGGCRRPVLNSVCGKNKPPEAIRFLPKTYNKRILRLRGGVVMGKQKRKGVDLDEGGNIEEDIG